MKLSLAALVVSAAVLGSTQSALAQASPLKEGDKVQLKCFDSGRWLSWYSGDWVVLDGARSPGAKGTWTVTNLSRDTKGTYTFRLKNAQTGTFMDGDNDNSVVLDDDDHNFWQIKAHEAKRGNATTIMAGTESEVKDSGFAYPISNTYWGGKFYLSDKENSARDVVLRSEDPGPFSARNGNLIWFYFVRAR